MSPRALWIPFEVDDIDVPRAFYRDRLGLSEVDSWSTAYERGTVLEVTPGAHLEFVSSLGSRRPGPPPLALELPTMADVEHALAALDPETVVRALGTYPRGHAGFEVSGPAGERLMVWTEKQDHPTKSERE
ncbi:VOC family protein [Actinokineospora sp. HUAS TT18]|uniref:VOC family protein n=1 Tax=Actinokineospora sp. HUAS TT18 TaxID=3447451 RepID=UPI003F51CAA0